MIKKLNQKMERGFVPWKAMLEENKDKLKEHGMTLIQSWNRKAKPQYYVCNY